MLSPILLAYTLCRAVKDGGLRYLKERLGFYEKITHQQSKASAPQSVNNTLWVHAASVGEVITVLPLVKCWLKSADAGHVLFTTGTPTGYQVLKKQNISDIEHVYLPIDFPGACQRFLNQNTIRQGWIVETEIWPWLYSRCQQADVKLTIINGRLSDKTSKQSTGFLANSYRRALANVFILTRTAEDARRFVSLGANADNIKIAGDLKYATTSVETTITPFIEQSYVLAASTHSNEELQIAEAYRRVEDSKTLLVIAPRHPERGVAISDELVKMGFSVALRSNGQTPNATHDIFLVDTLGELPVLYKHANAAFVGGSLIERGGHNIIEPAQFACPTIVGPHTFNFSDMIERLHSSQAIEIANTASDVAVFFSCVNKGSEELSKMGKRAQSIANDDRESTLLHYQKLLF